MRDELYIHHVLDCIGRVQRYCRSGEKVFFDEELIQDAVLRNLQTLAESTQRISDPLKASHPEIDWQAIAGFRSPRPQLPRNKPCSHLGDCLGPFAGAAFTTGSDPARNGSP